MPCSVGNLDGTAVPFNDSRYAILGTFIDVDGLSKNVTFGLLRTFEHSGQLSFSTLKR